MDIFRKMSCVLFETLAIVDGKVQNLYYHQQRYQQGLSYLIDVAQQDLPLKSSLIVDYLSIPSEYQTGLVRCRVDYDGWQIKVEFFPYQARQLQRFALLQADDLDYRYKYANRDAFNVLMQQKGHADDIIIIQHGLITDCSIGNLLFEQDGQWFTPQCPLLAGTQRAKLLAEGKIQLRDIAVNSLAHYQRMMMVNALNPFAESRAVQITPSTFIRTCS